HPQTRHRVRGGDPAAPGGGPVRARAQRRVRLSGCQRRCGRGGRGAAGHRPASIRGVTMLDELKEEAIVNKVGGRFKLSTLIQKRMVALNTGARPLVDVRGGDKMSIVIQEILQDKIYLDMSGQLQTRGAGPGDAARRAMLTDISDAGGGED